MTRNLSFFEWKEGWRWQPRTFNVKIGEKVAYLYNQEGKLLTASPYTCKFDELNMTQFGINCIQKLTNLPLDKVTQTYTEKHKIKEELWNIYRVPIEDEQFKGIRHRWIQIRDSVTILATPRPNALGFYYAEIESRINKDRLKLINDNVFELFIDFFFTLECFIGREQLPLTFSQAWYHDYKIYGNRRYSESTARYNVRQAYDNYIFDKIVDTFKMQDKTTFIHIITLFKKLRGENKYYIMETLLNDPHFEINDNDYVVYYPIIFKKEGEDVL